MLNSCCDVYGVKLSQLSCLKLFYTLKVQTYPNNKTAQVVNKDNLASNGVIHVIDALVSDENTSIFILLLDSIKYSDMLPPKSFTPRWRQRKGIKH